MRPLRLVLTVLLVLLGIACSSTQTDTTTPDPGNGSAEGSTTDLAPGEIPNVPREQLLDVLGQSVGDFLRNVEVEPAHAGGSFQGWRIANLSASHPSWLDVRQGDIVTSINRMPLERPEDAQRVWETLRVASEVVIELQRADETSTIRIPVDDGDETPEPEPAVEEGGE